MISRDFLFRLKRELEANNDSTSTPEAANSTSSTRRTTTNQQHRRRRPQESEMTEEEAEMRRRRRAARRAERLRMASTVASPTASVTSNPISNILGTTPGTHIATDHEDTTEGAVHCFQVNSRVFIALKKSISVSALKKEFTVNSIIFIGRIWKLAFLYFWTG